MRARARSFFAFHGKIEQLVISRAGEGHVRFNNARAAKSALLFDKASFLGQTISVQVLRGAAESRHGHATHAAAASARPLFALTLPPRDPPQLSDDEMPEATDAPTASPFPRNESFPTTARVSMSIGAPTSEPASSTASDAPEVPPRAFRYVC